MKDDIRNECVQILAFFESVPSKDWAYHYVRLLMDFYGKYCCNPFYLFSTSHGCDFFTHVIECLDGKEWEPDNTGEYEENFRRFIKHYQKL